MLISAEVVLPHTLIWRLFLNCWWPSETGSSEKAAGLAFGLAHMDAFKILPLELSRKVVTPYFLQFQRGGTKFYFSGAFSRSLHSRYSRAFGHPLLLPQTPRLCPPGPHAGAQARHLLPFRGYFSTWHLPIAGESNKFALVCVFTVLPSILIPGRNISLRSQRTH